MPKESSPTFEETLKKLEEIVSYLESGKADLDTSLAKYEEGVRLLRQCRAILNRAEQKIEILRNANAETGEIQTEPADLDTLTADVTTAVWGKSPRRAKGSGEEPF